MTKHVIDLQHVYKSFNKKPVLNDICLKVNQGEIVGLIGPSGAGKSTTIKTTLGMEKADSGEATVLGSKMPNRKLLKNIGYMAQTDALYESLTGRENLKFFAEMKGVHKNNISKQIKYIGQLVELSNELDLRVSNYSGGMKRRLSLAIALLGNPQLLVLDEPTVGIDPALRRKIWQELFRLSAQGTSILITTHVMDEAELTNRVALLLDSKLIANDTPQNLEKQYNVKTIEDVFLKVEGVIK